MTPGMPDPCQPIGCNNGIHLPGCVFDEPFARKHPLAHCETCPFGCDSTKPVLGRGPEGHVEIAILGEAPGQYEDFAGRPFVGPSGQILDEILRNNDIDRSKVWVTNAVACRPEDNATPNADAIAACSPRLMDELVMHAPTYTIAAGATAAKALGLNGAMAKIRIGPPKSVELVASYDAGDVLTSHTMVIPTFHPAYGLRLADAIPTIDFDISKAVKGTTTEPWHAPQLVVADDIDTAGDAILDLWEMPGPFSVDIETGFEKDDSDFHADQRPLLCIGVGYEPGKVVVFGKNVMTDSRVMENLALLFREKHLTMHNGKSDVAGLYPVMGRVNLTYDTMLEHYVLDERTGGHSLGQLGIELVGTPEWKSLVKPYLAKGKEKNFADIPLDILYRYNAIDCDVTYRLHLAFWGELVKQDRARVATMLVQAAKELVHLEMDGIGFDMPYSIKLSEDYQEALKINEGRMEELLGEPINPRSPKQLLELFKRRGWYIPMEKRKQTTAAPALTAALERGIYADATDATDFLELLFENRKLSKDDGTFVRGLQKVAVKLADDTHRIHTTYTLHVATTGRLSSKSPNLQNVKDVAALRRQFVVGQPGDLFLQGDYSQVEGRVIAVLSGDEYLGSLFRNADRDIFDELSVAMYGSLIKEKRRLLKTFFYGIAYERTAHGISKGFGIPLDEADRQFKEFKALIPGVIDWQEETWQKVQDQGYLETSFGRRRHFPLITNRNKDDVRREAMAFVPQSTASDICLTAFTRMRPHLDSTPISARLTIHDAIVVETPAAMLDTAENIMTSFMVASGNYWAREQHSDVPFAVAFKSGPSWDKLG